MIVTSEAIVLRARKHGETSKIVTLYTKEYGKLNVIAKGAREMKSKFGGSLEMGARIGTVFYKKEGQEGLLLLSKAELVSSNSRILKSLARIEAATEIIEIVIRCMHDEEQNLEVYELLSETLSAFSSVANDEATVPIQLRFYLEFCRIAGYELRLRTHGRPTLGSESRQESQAYFEVASGELREIPVSPTGAPGQVYPGIRVSPEARSTLLYLERSSIEKAAALRITDRTRTQLTDLFLAYFAEHLSGITGKNLRSGRVFSSL